MGLGIVLLIGGLVIVVGLWMWARQRQDIGPMTSAEQQAIMSLPLASNDDAVAFLREQKVSGLDVDLVAAALQCRQEARDPQHLFSARAVLPRQVEACARLAGLQA